MSIGAIFGGGSSISAWDRYNGLKESLSGASSSGNEAATPDSVIAQAALSAVAAPVTVAPDSIRSKSAGASGSGVSLASTEALSPARDPQNSSRDLAGLLPGHGGSSPAATPGASATQAAGDTPDPDAGGDTSPDGDGPGLQQYVQAFQSFMQWSDRTIVQTATIVPTPNASIEQIIVKTASPG